MPLVAAASVVAALAAFGTAAQAQTAGCSGTVCNVTVAADPGTSNTGTTGAAGTLSNAVAYANANPGTTINVYTNVTLTGPLSPILNSTTIAGAGGNYAITSTTNRIFFVGTDVANEIGGARQAVSISNLTLTGTATGGAGANGGGGGLGAGGALFVAPSADVTLSSVSFANNHAVGGTGATGGGGGGGGLGGGGGTNFSGGGGGLYGNGAGGGSLNNGNTGGGGGGVFGTGGQGDLSDTGGGGGGYAGAGGNGALSGTGAAGSANPLSVAGRTGSGGSGGGASPGPGGANGGGGGGAGGDGTFAAGGGGGGGFNGSPGNASTGGAGAFGGGGGGGGGAGNGGSGGFGGGGGGSSGNGGNGGFGGGGGGGFGGGAGGYGGGGGSNGGFGGQGGGNGGFGGGGGNSNSGAAGSGGFGAGAGTTVAGGGGAALGGAVFVASGGTLAISGSSTDSGGGVTGGSGANNGSAYGSGFFFQGTQGQTTTLTYGAGTQSVSNVIADYTGSGGTNPSGGTNAADQGGSVGVTKNGAGTLTLSGANTYTGGTTFGAGVINVGSTGALGSTGTLSFSGGTLQYSANNQTDYSGRFSTAANQAYSIDTNGQTVNYATGLVSSGGSLTKLGTGTLTLSGANTYSGATLVSAGTLLGGAANAFSANSATTIGGGTLNLGGFADTINAVTLTSGMLTNGSLAGTVGASGGTVSSIGGTAAVNVAGGTVSFTANTYTGATNVSGGTAQGTAANAFSANSATTISGGTLNLGGFADTINAVTLTSGTLTSGSLAGTVGASGGTISSIAGTAAVNVTGGTVSFAADSYSGATNVSGGTAQGTAANAFSAGSATTIGGGTLNLGGFADTINAVTLTSGTLTSGSLAGTVGASGGTISSIAGTAAVNVTGGTVSFAADSYSGATNVNGGTAQGAAANAFSANSPVAVSLGAILNLAGFNQTILSLSGAGSVALGAGTLVLSNASGTFSGSIGGSGGLTLTAGRETLSGANIYSGGTQLNGGTLVVGNNSALGTGTLSMAAGTALGFLSGNNFTIANNIVISGDPNFMPPLGTAQTLSGVIADGSSPGTLAINGAGTLVLTGNNIYTGGTMITGGTLQLGNGGTSGSIVGNVADNGTLAFDRSDAITLAGAITGSGTLQQNGGLSSKVILTGTNTYSGGTFINNGTLQIGNGGTSGSISGNVTDNGALTFNRSDNMTFGGLISGTGSVAQMGPGTLSLPNANTYSGGTFLLGGTLAVGNKNALGTGILGMVDGTTLTFTQNGLNIPNAISLGVAAGTVDTGANTETLSGSISGRNDLTKVGSGTLFLSAVNTYTGPTNVNAGTLDVTGSIAASSLTTVANGAALTGAGTIGNLAIISGATFAPGGGTPGTTTAIAGNLAFQAGALYLVSLNPTTSTSASVTGTASLAGSVGANFATGTYISKVYTILSAGSVTGTFGGLTTTNLPANFTASLAYDNAHAYLDLTLNLTPPPTAPGYTPLNVNENSVAATLIGHFNATGGIPMKFGTLAPAGLLAADGEDATGAERSAFNLTNEFMALMLDPFVYGRGGATSGSGGALGFAPEQEQHSDLFDTALGYNPALTRTPPPVTFDQRWTAWGSAFGGSATTNGDPVVGSNNVTTTTYGYAGGMDYRYSPDTVLGFALAGGGTGWSLANALGSGRSNAFLTGGYGVTHLGPAYLAGALAFANNWFGTSRTALGDQLQANFAGQSYAARLEGGYRFGVLPTLGVTPYAAVTAQDFHTPGYSEADPTGGGFGLTYASMNATDVRTELGARFDAPTAVAGMPLILRSRLAWAHDFVSNPALSAAFQALPGSTFTVNGAPIPNDSALASAGAELFLRANWSVLVKFDGEFAAGSQTYAGTGTLRYTW